MTSEPEDRPSRHKGPVTVRGPRSGSSTTDQHLLDSRGPTDWVHTDPWRCVTRMPLILAAQRLVAQPGGS